MRSGSSTPGISPWPITPIISPLRRNTARPWRSRRKGRKNESAGSGPRIEIGASRAMRCHPAKEKDMVKIDLPKERAKDWKEAMLKKMAEVLDKYRSVRLFMDICVKCGACADKCQFFLGTGDPKNMPVARADLFRKVYKRYFTLGGKIWGRANEAEELNETVLEEWFTYFYQCSECRRCSVFCPYGIDTAEITMAAREIMAAAGIATKYVTEVVAKVYDTGNNLGIGPPAWKDKCAFLEEDLKDIGRAGHQISRSMRWAPKSCWSPLRPTTLPTPTR